MIYQRPGSLFMRDQQNSRLPLVVQSEEARP